VLLVGALLFPVYWVGSASLTTNQTILSSSGIRLVPDDLTLRQYAWVIGGLEIPSYEVAVRGFGYRAALTTPGFEMPVDCSRFDGGCSSFPRYLGNSLIVAGTTVVIAMCVVIPAAYALSRRKFIGRRKILFGYVLLTQVGGGLGIALLIGLYTVFVQIGLNDSKLALSVYYAATAVPFNTWLLKTYMDGIPISYEEAAVVDGAPAWRVVVEVILPLSKAGLATVFIFTFLTGWTEFVVAQTLLGTENYTLPVGLFSLVSEYSVPWARFSAFALTFASPIMLVYLFAQRYIEGGLSFGGMEG